MYIDTGLVLPMYNAYPYFSLKNLGTKKCALYMANMVVLINLLHGEF